MKSIFRLVLLVAAILVVQPASAQRLLEKAMSKAKEKLDQKVEQKVDQKVDEKIDEGLNKVEESLEKKNEQSPQPEGQAPGTSESRDQRSQQRMQGILKGLGVSGEPVPVADAYSFSTMIKMHLESYDGSGKKTSDGDFVTYMSPNDMNFAYEAISGDVGNKGKGIFILDFKNKASIILSEEGGKKTGLIYGLNFLLDNNYQQVEEPDQAATTESLVMNPYVKKTGRTKNIAGYSCEEFHYNNPEEASEAWYWMTKDLNVKTRDFMGALFKSTTFAAGMGWGYLMESEAIDRNTKERSLMRVTDISTNANKNFVLSQYQVTNIGSINIPSGQ